jgi:trehalose-6-phosphate synthase
LLGNDLLGFHLDQYCQNFLHCAERVLGAMWTRKPASSSTKDERPGCAVSHQHRL